MELIPIKFKKIMQSNAYTCIILGAENKLFAIYTDPIVGRTLQINLMNEPHPRPYTHDLMNYIFEGLDVSLKQVVINDIEDTTYFSRLFLEQQIGDQKRILEIDCRPSDSITLALNKNVPVYCSKEVLEKAVPVEE
jgi:hypothetical protein